MNYPPNRNPAKNPPVPEQIVKTDRKKPTKEKIEEILDLLDERLVKGEISEET